MQRYILNSKLFKEIFKLEANLSVSNFYSNYLNHSNSIKIEVTDLELKPVNSYNSILSAARVLVIRGTTISNFLILPDSAVGAHKLNHLKEDIYSKNYNLIFSCVKSY